MNCEQLITRSYSIRKIVGYASKMAFSRGLYTVILVTLGMAVGAISKAETQEYMAEFNACNNGSNTAYCHCAANQLVNRSADIVYSIQYCLEKERGVRVTQEEIFQKLERDGTVQKSIEACIIIGRQTIPGYTAVIAPVG